MRWILLWVCACNGDVTAIHIANTEARCIAIREALHERQGGAYICAKYADTMSADHVEIWTARDSGDRPRVVRNANDGRQRTP